MTRNAMFKRFATMLLTLLLILQIGTALSEDHTVETRTIVSTPILRADGELCEVTVSYGDDARIPEGASLRVTDLAADSEAYGSARDAVLADMRARGEAVDEGTLGLAAVDIAILDADGNEIEPAAPVRVDMRIMALPGVEDLGDVAGTLAVQHHAEAEEGVVVETVYDGDGKASGNVTGLDIGFETASFSMFTISWRNNSNTYNRSARVHYVDESGRELTISNPSNLYPTLNADSTSPAYLIYDIAGYEYSYTYSNYYGIRIDPLLRKRDNRWQYRYNNYWYEIADNDDIYVVYKKKNAIAQGGTPTVRQSDDVAPPVDPRINKTSTRNGDDTNTIALSLISDTAALEVEKLADVIVVFDVSGSMTTNDMGGTRLQAAQNAVNSLADQLAKKKNSNGDPLVRMSLIQFSTTASFVIEHMTDLTDSGLRAFKSKVNGLSADGGTNWDHALQLANEESDLDPGRATFVIFVTDGDPTFRNTRMNVANNVLATEVFSNNQYYLSDHVYGPGSDDNATGQCYAAAVLQGKAIRSAGKNLFTIGISNSVTKISAFNSDVGGNGAYLVENQTALEQAFSDIEASITGALGWGNIQMTDGITNLSNTVQKTGLTQVGGDFTYWIAPAPGNWSELTAEQKNSYTPVASDFVSWDPVAAGAGLAEYDAETGAVKWNMGSTFMPEAGVTYQVRFKVWPSQEAYDTIAKLNNGTLNYDTLPQDVKAQIIKNGSTYTLKTNEPNAQTTYQSATRSGDTVTASGDIQTLTFPTVEDLNLHVDKMTVTKNWVNSLDPDARWKSDVELLLTDGNGNLYKNIELNDANDYTANDNFISCGLAKIENGQLIIYETGHDFKMTEPAEYAYYWDLDSEVYRPMVIDSVLTMLMKTDAPAGMGSRTYYVSGGKTYYRIDGGVYEAIATGDAAASITATNIRRSNLNLTKRVQDENGADAVSSEPFEFTIQINDTQDADVWFAAQRDANDTSTIVKDLVTNATAEVEDGEPTGYYHAPSGSAITVKIEPGWNLRFTNLPNGTTYTITEGAKDDYTFVSAVIDNDGTFSVTNGTTGAGTINESNTQYTVTYTNRTAAKKVQVLKVRPNGTPLANAEFALYTPSGYEADPQYAVKTRLISGADGMIDLGNLAHGTYYLAETAAPTGYVLLPDPVKIEVSSTGVICTQGDDDLPVSGNITTGFTVTVTDTPAATTLPIPVKKTLKGRDMEADEFNFVLQPIDINGNLGDASAKQTTTNPAGAENEEVTFNFALDYTYEDIAAAPYHDTAGNGVYYYIVYEEEGNADDIYYSELKYIVKVTLSYDEESKALTATPKNYLYDGTGQLPADARQGLREDQTV